MAKVKLTKTALKQERDALKQYVRFLPTLQLKKQQLQMEMMACRNRIEANEKREGEASKAMESWLSVFADPEVPGSIAKALSVRKLNARAMNIAGVEVPVFESVDFDLVSYDVFETPPWLDDAVDAIKKIAAIRLEREIIREQFRRLENELRTTSQRVNLFEKVKIPETRENIRVIQISISDSQISAVARSKLAKKKLQETAA